MANEMNDATASKRRRKPPVPPQPVQHDYTGKPITISGDGQKVERCKFGGTDYGQIAVRVTGKGVEFDHCTIAGFVGQGMSLDAKAGCRNPHVHHCLFQHSKRDENKNVHEALQLGRSIGDTSTNLGALIEYLVFDDTDAELEAVSIKTSGNIIRNIVLVNVRRAVVSHRHGANNKLIGIKGRLRVLGGPSIITDIDGDVLWMAGDTTQEEFAGGKHGYPVAAGNRWARISGKQATGEPDRKIQPSDNLEDAELQSWTMVPLTVADVGA